MYQYHRLERDTLGSRSELFRREETHLVGSGSSSVPSFPDDEIADSRVDHVSHPQTQPAREPPPREVHFTRAHRSMPEFLGVPDTWHVPGINGINGVNGVQQQAQSASIHLSQSLGDLEYHDRRQFPSISEEQEPPSPSAAGHPISKSLYQLGAFEEQPDAGEEDVNRQPFRKASGSLYERKQDYTEYREIRYAPTSQHWDTHEGNFEMNSETHLHPDERGDGDRQSHGLGHQSEQLDLESSRVNEVKARNVRQPGRQEQEGREFRERYIDNSENSERQVLVSEGRRVESHPHTLHREDLAPEHVQSRNQGVRRVETPTITLSGAEGIQRKRHPDEKVHSAEGYRPEAREMHPSGSQNIRHPSIHGTGPLQKHQLGPEGMHYPVVRGHIEPGEMHYRKLSETDHLRQRQMHYPEAQESQHTRPREMHYPDHEIAREMYSRELSETDHLRSQQMHYPEPQDTLHTRPQHERYPEARETRHQMPGEMYYEELPDPSSVRDASTSRAGVRHDPISIVRTPLVSRANPSRSKDLQSNHPAARRQPGPREIHLSRAHQIHHVGDYVGSRETHRRQSLVTGSRSAHHVPEAHRKRVEEAHTIHLFIRRQKQIWAKAKFQPWPIKKKLAAVR